jgi:hypothetical protein
MQTHLNTLKPSLKVIGISVLNNFVARSTATAAGRFLQTAE